MNKKLAVKSILWFFTAFGGTIAVLRLIHGLGATTALSDMDPWGFWIGFDVMAGVALAAGGFTLAAIVYIFGIEKLRPVTRPAIITAFLGYIIVALGLIFDLGIPWNIWHPMVYWQHHSVLFEVGTCVMLYLTVLAIEVAPIVLESPVFSHPIFHKAYKFLKFFTIPVVILGIMLSTLHQSSLGSLFLIMPFRVDALWYSPILYIHYFISAVGLGCAMVIVESTVTGFVYDHKPNLDIFKILGRISSVVLAIYLIIRVGDLAVRGILPQAFNGSWKSNLFIVEILISTVIPIILFNLPAARAKISSLFIAALFVVAGFIMNRQDILVTMERKGNSLYFPSLGELGITAFLISGATLVFFFFVENFELFSHGHKPEETENQSEKEGRFLFWELKELEKAFVLYSALIIAGVGLAFLLVPSTAVHGYAYPETPVRDAVGWETLKIDGNRAHEFVMFPHREHIKRLGNDKESCVKCHHMSRPGDGPSSCNECHKDMYLEKSIFSHKDHQAILGHNKSCDKCHVGTKESKHVLSCNTADCHQNLLKSDTSSYMAVSYMDAMHHQCRECHEKEADRAVSIKELQHTPVGAALELPPKDKLEKLEKIGYCGACHPGMPEDAEITIRTP